MLSQDTLNQLSRRKWLRDAAIAATGAVVLPPLLTGCTDHRVDPLKGGLGSAPPITNDELERAAQNLIRMSMWYDNLYGDYTQPYIFRVYSLVKGGNVPPTKWTEIFVDVFIEIGLGILGAALSAFPGVGPAIAITVHEIEKWGTAQKGGKGVDATISEFVQGYDDMHDTIVSRLNILASSDGSYAALREAFKGGDLEFNGKKYSLQALAQQHFPDRTAPADVAQYDALIQTAHLKFKKYIWFAMIVKAGVMTPSDYWSFSDVIGGHAGMHPTAFGRNEHYKNYPATYLRSYYDSVLGRFYYTSWYFTFDGHELSADAAKDLFKDDTPGNNIYAGLWNRDHVFKQFHREKQQFGVYYDLRNDFKTSTSGNSSCYSLDCSSHDYGFTGGDFPEIFKK